MNCSKCNRKLLRFEVESDPDEVCFLCRMGVIIAKNKLEEELLGEN